MAREHLSEELIAAGSQLLTLTDELEMQAQGAMWIYSHMLQDWRYYLVTSLVDSIGRLKTYRLLLKVFEKHHFPRGMTIEDIHLGSPNDDLFRRISAIGVQGNGRARVSNSLINGVLFDGMIYRTIKDPLPNERQVESIEKRFSKRVKDLTLSS